MRASSKIHRCLATCCKHDTLNILATKQGRGRGTERESERERERGSHLILVAILKLESSFDGFSWCPMTTTSITHENQYIFPPLLILSWWLWFFFPCRFHPVTNILHHVSRLLIQRRQAAPTTTNRHSVTTPSHQIVESLQQLLLQPVAADVEVSKTKQRQNCRPSSSSSASGSVLFPHLWSCCKQQSR